jgi:hypothetical protein
MPLHDWLFTLLEAHTAFDDDSPKPPPPIPVFILLTEFENHRLLRDHPAFKALVYISRVEDPQLAEDLVDLVIEKSQIMETVTIDEDSKDESELECGICKEKYGEETRETCGVPSKCKACPCKAHFGYYCLKEWVWLRGTCPNCRAEVE